MARAIDADELLRELTCNFAGVPFHGNRKLTVSWIRRHIETAPTIDPESLRPRGTWEGTADGYANGELVYDTWTCSECGYTVDTDDPDALTKFCPNCGAKMEGGHNP